MNTTITSLAQLYEALERHDWFHEMSDDHGVWECGQANWKAISRAAAKLGPKAEQMVKDFTLRHLRQFAHRTTEPKPKLEDYL
jgi:hypothetical protein